MTREKLEDLRSEFGDLPGAAPGQNQTNKTVGNAGISGQPPQSITQPTNQASMVQIVTKAEVAELLQIPFDLAGFFTGSEAFGIDINNNKLMVDKAYDVCVKFGWDKMMASKYLDLALFGGMYLMAWAGCINEYREERQIKNEKARQAKNSRNRPGQDPDSGTYRERQDTACEIPDPLY